MTNELEKQFFDTFGIEPKKVSFCGIRRCVYQHPSNCTKEECPFYAKDKIRYPQITDRILLDLICILTCWHLDEREPYEITSINIEQLKNQILSNSLYIAKYAKAKKRVQTLFKEG